MDRIPRIPSSQPRPARPVEGSRQDLPARDAGTSDAGPQAAGPIAEPASAYGADAQRGRVRWVRPLAASFAAGAAPRAVAPGQSGEGPMLGPGDAPQEAGPSNAPHGKRPRMGNAPVGLAARALLPGGTTGRAAAAGVCLPLPSARLLALVPERDLQLASYVLACEAMGQPIDDKTLDRLHRISRVGGEVQKRLPYGRGNVESDIRRTDHEATYRFNSVRDGAIPGYLPSWRWGEPAADSMYTAAETQFAGSGACAEISSLTAALLARELKDGESLHEAATTGEASIRTVTTPGWNSLPTPVPARHWSPTTGSKDRRSVHDTAA